MTLSQLYDLATDMVQSGDLIPCPWDPEAAEAALLARGVRSPRRVAAAIRSLLVNLDE